MAVCSETLFQELVVRRPGNTKILQIPNIIQIKMLFTKLSPARPFRSYSYVVELNPNHMVPSSLRSSSTESRLPSTGEEKNLQHVLIRLPFKRLEILIFQKQHALANVVKFDHCLKNLYSICFCLSSTRRLKFWTTNGFTNDTEENTKNKTDQHSTIKFKKEYDMMNTHLNYKNVFPFCNSSWTKVPPQSALTGFF